MRRHNSLAARPFPEIADPIALKAALPGEQATTRILLSETEQTLTLSSAFQHAPAETYAMAIGPEGGWAPEEMALFTEHSWTHVTLGPRILRAETATPSPPPRSPARSSASR